MGKSQQLWFARWGLALITVLFMTATPFAQDSASVVPELAITEQPAAISIAEKDKPVTITFAAQKGEETVSYQWFKSADGSTENAEAIEGANEGSFSTDVFTEQEIRYYFCVATVGEETVTSDVAAVAYTGLPVLYVNTPKGVEITSKEDWTKKTFLTLRDAGKADWNFEDVQTSIRGRGNSTWEQDKKPYALKLNDKREIMGMSKHKRWVLIANYLDNSFLKNHMAFFLSKNLKMDYTVKGKYVNLVFNGVYRGLYWLGEAIKVDKARVNIYDGEDGMTDNQDKDLLIEMDNHYDEIVKFTSSIREMPYMVKNDDYFYDEDNDNNMTSGGYARIKRFQDKIKALEKLLYPDYVDGMNTNDCAAPDEAYTKVIDVKSWAKFWLINEIMDNTELNEPKSAYFSYVHKDEGDVFKAGPAWDFDAGASTDNAPVKLDTSIYYNALFKSPLFISALEEVWEEYKSMIDASKINAEIDLMRDTLKVAAKVDSLRWGVHLDLSGIERPDYDAYVDFLKSSLDNKFAVVSDYISALPQKETISPKLALATDTFEYNGAENKPAVLITDEGNELVEGEDYVITYADNIDAGTARAIFNGIGNYAGWQELPFTITPKPATVYVIDTLKMYGESDPELPYRVEGLVERDGVMETVVNLELFRAPGDTVGIYGISTAWSMIPNSNYDLKAIPGWFRIVPDSTEILVTVTGHKDSLVYDGTEQSVSGFDMVSNREAYSVDFVKYTGDSTVTGTNAGTYAMGLADSNFANTSKNYSNVSFVIDDGKLEVLPKPVSLTIANASKTYGEEDPEFTYTTEGLLTFNEVEDSLKNVTLTREEGTDAGEYAITANVDADSNANYAVKVNNGVFTINPDTTKVVVTIKGHVDTLTFNGKNQSVHGFDFASSNEAYTLDFVNFTGDSVATGKDAKQFTMELADTNFKNVSVNYSNVEFNVKNGNLVILPKPVTLTVANVSKTYGDKDPELTYTVEGLVKIDTVQDELKDVTLKRKSGEDVGEYSITASVKGKSNPNYIVSTTKGVFKINPDTTKIVVTIKGHVDTVEYDGKKHTVHGFDFSSDCSSYSIDLVSFGGDSVVSGTKVKTYSMGLTSDQFKNSSANYSNVVFKVKDGNLVIVKPKEQDGLIASPSRATLLRLTTMDRRIQVNSTMMGKPYAVFDMQGVVVQSGRVDAASFEIPVSKSGVYMVRVGSLAQRVNVK
ncbi:MBG domain-containing protein [uncultured Fibrobacter sp.]|uniref:MBG domain-containing protein n=1 Tax=uncultured Fibrobacter sp. TaxID=261512 RepID=UPI0025D91EEA|nr:MBG domain-containing protein [uncultured Fibrobacter sp.]